MNRQKKLFKAGKKNKLLINFEQVIVTLSNLMNEKKIYTEDLSSQWF
jgi:hypothetical protein